MTEGKEPPIVRAAKALAVFDHHIEPMEGPRKISPARCGINGPVRMLPSLGQSQFLDNDCTLWKVAMLLVVAKVLQPDIDIVELRERRLAIVQRIGGNRRSDESPFPKTRGQDQFPRLCKDRAFRLAGLRDPNDGRRQQCPNQHH